MVGNGETSATVIASAMVDSHAREPPLPDLKRDFHGSQAAQLSLDEVRRLLCGRKTP
jgi:hypothetical protein